MKPNPVPPSDSGTAHEKKPSSPIRRTRSRRNSWFLSSSTRVGAMSFSANSRAVSCTSFCSSVSSKFMLVVHSPDRRQRVVLVDLVAHRDPHGRHRAVGRRVHDRLHLHRLEHQQLVVLFDGVADRPPAIDSTFPGQRGPPRLPPCRLPSLALCSSPGGSRRPGAAATPEPNSGTRRLRRESKAVSRQTTPAPATLTGGTEPPPCAQSFRACPRRATPFRATGAVGRLQTPSPANRPSAAPLAAGQPRDSRPRRQSPSPTAASVRKMPAAMTVPMDASEVRAHGEHQQVVLPIGLGPHLVGDPGRHRYGRKRRPPRRAD